MPLFIALGPYGNERVISIEEYDLRNNKNESKNII